ncbi:hypothetical protein CYY_006685 [Polysphondylium violaceum]|uniref:Uncharacterized protein n=1 Tax=Polysphondylium violaceum TaxID=133409 RepID=A0A8J4PZ98_9MYCE|nr:hypothetical protein CYY_006685 [Polysphondylium violaceum]
MDSLLIGFQQLLQKECEETLISCPFDYFGCKTTFHKEYLNIHLKSDEHIYHCYDVLDRIVSVTKLERGNCKTTFQFLGVEALFSYNIHETTICAMVFNLENQPFAKDYEFSINLYDINNCRLNKGQTEGLADSKWALFMDPNFIHKFHSITLTIFKKK